MHDEKTNRRRLTATVSRKIKTGHRLPSPHQRTPPSSRSSHRSKPIKILKRCSSDPTLCPDRFRGGDEIPNMGFSQDGKFFRPHTCTDILTSSPSLFDFSPQRLSFEGYSKKTKVVVNVTVEGSPGPIRTMVKLDSSVEDTIQLVMEKYTEEGRTPMLRPAETSLELFPSYFSLQSLDKSELIGDVGSRSFYLRKGSSPVQSIGASTANSFDPEGERPPSAIVAAQFWVPSYLSRKITKIMRRTNRLWKMVFCSR